MNDLASPAGAPDQQGADAEIMFDRIATILHDHAGICGHCNKPPSKCAHRGLSVLPGRINADATLAAIKQASVGIAAEVASLRAQNEQLREAVRKLMAAELVQDRMDAEAFADAALTAGQEPQR